MPRVVEAVVSEDIGDASVEAFAHAAGLRPSHGNEAVLDVQFPAFVVEGLPVGRGALSGAGEAVGELLAVVGEDTADLSGECPGQAGGERGGGARASAGKDLGMDPAGGGVGGDEQIAAMGRVSSDMRGRYLTSAWKRPSA